MSREIQGHSRRHRQRRLSLFLALFTLLAVSSCHDFRWPDADGPWLPNWNATTGMGSNSDPKPLVQEGEVTVRDGDDTQVSYKTPFQSPPRLAIVGFAQSWFDAKPYATSDFQFVKQEATYFKVQSNHAEQARGAWATVKWRAEGIRAAEKPAGTGPGLARLPQDSKERQEQLIARIKRLGGAPDPHPSGSPLIAIDLHRTKVSDADLGQLQGLASLRTLNLSGTKISDAALGSVSTLTGLQTLYLNDTAVTDAGLQQLQSLTNLKELGLYRTRVTDVGLTYLKGLTNLQSLTLGGSQITDRGLMQLKSLRNLRHLLLSGTSVTTAGVEELQKALPKTRIIH